MTELPPAYYLPLGDGHFEPTEATTSPWDAGAQHGGPPTALLASCLDDAFGRPGLRVARISMDFLGPVSRATSSVQTELLRPGRRTQLSEASLWAGERRVAVARVWHLATGPGPEAEAAGPARGNGAHTMEDAGPPPGGSGPVPGGSGPRPEAEHAIAGPVPVGDAGIAEYDGALPGDLPDPHPQLFFGDDDQWGYGRATEWRTVSGGYASTTGRADVWTRVRIPLIAGRPLDGLARFAIVADSANGLSAPLSFREWLFIPPGVTMHLHRYPAGEWVRLTANSDPGQDGIGLTDGALSDATGRCGTVAQPLLVAPRQARSLGT
ncbi:MAG: thioesterase family protein [Streptosporangiaceae bacterium]